MRAGKRSEFIFIFFSRGDIAHYIFKGPGKIKFDKISCNCFPSQIE